MRRAADVRAADVRAADVRAAGWLLPALLALLVAAAVLSLVVSRIGLDPVSFVSRLFSGEEASWVILTEVRLPRMLLAILIGASLGVSGAALQGILQNPLAEPGLVGVTASASLGAVAALYSGLSAAFALALPVFGMVGAGVAVVLIKALAGRQATATTLILAGVAVSSMAGAATALALNLAPSPFAITEIVFWMLGSLTDRTLDQVWLSAPFMLAGIALMLSLGRALDALTLGEDAARTLGFDIGRVRWLAVAGTALAVGAGTSVAGAIGFVGLVVPHLLRPFVGFRPGALLWPSALGGACLILFADILVRLLVIGPELKIGVLTALLGAPFFLHLLLRLRRDGV